MKEITISMDDETCRRARIEAAERNSSVSQLIRDYLASLASAYRDNSHSTRALSAALDKANGFRAGNRKARD